MRMGASTKKQYLSLAGMPILSRTILPFEKSSLVDKIYLVVPEADFNYCRKEVILPFHFKTEIQLIAGGNERQDSVYNGLKAAKGSNTILIHDGVRPFISNVDIKNSIQQAEKTGACILGIPAFDTLKEINANNEIINTVDRSNICMAQTPQTFNYDLILSCHLSAREKNYKGTDDASLVEFSGKTVAVIPGSRHNIKITTKEDYALAKKILALFPHNG